MRTSNKKTMAKGSFARFVGQNMGELPRFMIFAVLEWLLIFMLFLDGFFAFVANEFAKFFELTTPCWLCTRIDHILVNRHNDFYYNDSICESHKKDVSYLAYCHNHKKLSDIRKMCEGCLLSFATEKESDFDTYKSLVGILHKDLECFVEDDHHQIQMSVPAARTWEDAGPVEKTDSLTIGCSCCGLPLKRTAASKGKNVGGVAHAPTPSPRAPRNDDNPNLELPHIRYTELKFMSDTESEMPEDEYGAHPKNLKEDPKSTVPLLTESDELHDDSSRTPVYGKGNRFFGIPLTDSAQNSPRVSMKISRKSPLEKSEFGMESVEGHTPNDAECDSVLHRLKRQVRLDRKSLMALYMELDEERSASAVAANNAMAMITRLQAEKAAVQMEALQYQRMMEEQAEYDQEALEATYDMLARREEELRGYEAEIDAYREKYGLLKEFVYKEDEAGEGSPPLGLNNSEITAENSAPNDQVVPPSKDENGEAPHVESLKPLKGEKTYLLGRLKKLDKRSNLSSNGFHSLPDGLIDDETGNGNKAALTRQLSLLTHLSERAKVLESDTGLLDYAAKTLDKHSEGTKLLTEITHNLQKLRQLVTMPPEEQHSGFSSQNSGVQSQNKAAPSQNTAAAPSQNTAPPSQSNAGPAQNEEAPSESKAGSAQNKAAASESKEVPSQSNAGSAQNEAGPSESKAGPSQSNAGPSQTNSGQSQSNASPSQ